MRTFIAIPIPEACRTMLDRMQKNLRVFQADVRWVAIASIHLTLKFLGEADPAVVAALADSLHRASLFGHPFSLRLRGLGCFPNPRHPRVIWCGIDGEMEALSQLKKTVEDTCADFGFASEGRDFHPHLTLGRVTGKRNVQLLLDCIKMGSDMESSFVADQYRIYKSTLKPSGAEYSVLHSIHLGAR